MYRQAAGDVAVDGPPFQTSLPDLGGLNAIDPTGQGQRRGLWIGSGVARVVAIIDPRRPPFLHPNPITTTTVVLDFRNARNSSAMNGCYAADVPAKEESFLLRATRWAQDVPAVST